MEKRDASAGRESARCACNFVGAATKSFSSLPTHHLHLFVLISLQIVVFNV